MALSGLDSISDAQFEAFCRAVEQSKEKRMKVCTVHVCVCVWVGGLVWVWVCVCVYCTCVCNLQDTQSAQENLMSVFLEEGRRQKTRVSVICVCVCWSTLFCRNWRHSLNNWTLLIKIWPL